MNGVEFSAKELKELVVSSVSCVRVQRRVRHISLLPKYLGDTKSAINVTLNSFQNKFDIRKGPSYIDSELQILDTVLRDKLSPLKTR